MASKIEKCTGKIILFYDVDTGSVSNDLIPGEAYDFYEPYAKQKFVVNDAVTYITVSEPPRGKRIVKQVVKR
jgi:hypothetical protein